MAFASRELLTVTDLKTYFYAREGVVQAVDGVTLSIGHGQTVGLVGESGSGKSVTALSVMRLIDYPGKIVSGSIRYEGKELTTLDSDEMRDVRGDEIAMIFQEPMTSLNPVYTVGDQIAETITFHQKLSKRAAWKRAIEMLGLVGIPSPERRVSDYPHQMSGGMRQRVMIAMALSCNPKLLIADEPTTALEVTIQAQILDLMLKLQQEFGMSILLITHDLGVVARMCEFIYVMYAGQVVERASAHDLFTSPQAPYTEGLLKSIPRLGMTQAQKLAVIEGVVPNPTRWPTGCRFMARCEYRFDKCKQPPPLFELGGQSSRCWLCEGGRRPVKVPGSKSASA
ncbi:MAG TPA: ABC transporter ATP-binding protein [Candidatus Acidoferrum sp.]|nr:ABC transporter ATP-binding protein [Candidatus Acidoferrum sp.]